MPIYYRGRLANTQPANPEDYGLPSHAKEIIDQRTPGSKTFALGGNEYAQVLSNSVNFPDDPFGDSHETSAMHPVRRGSGWEYRNGPSQVFFHRDHVDISRPCGCGLSWLLPSRGWLVNNNQDYELAYNLNGIVWQYTARKHGVKLSGTVSNAQGPAEYRFRYALLGEAEPLSVQTDGSLSNGYIFIPAPVIRDANGATLMLAWTVYDNQTIGFDLDDTGLALPYEIDPSATVAVSASADDGYVTSTSATYPPVQDRSTVSDTTSTTLTVERSFASSTYTTSVGLIRFNTSSLPSGNISISAATLRLYVTAKNNADNRDLYVEYYTTSAIGVNDWTNTESNSAGSATISSLTTSATNDITLGTLSNLNLTGYTTFRLHITPRGTPTGAPSGVNNVTIAAYDHVSLQEPQLIVTYTIPNNGRTITYSYNATTTSGGTATNALIPGTGNGRSFLRFPLVGEIPPLATITSVSLTGTATAGGAAGSWSIYPYKKSGVFSDPEEDTFATQYTNGTSASAYVTSDTTWRSAGAFSISLGATAVSDIQNTLLDPKYGYIGLCIIEDGENDAAPTLTNVRLVLVYTIGLPTTRALHDAITVQLLSADIPPVVKELELGEYAMRATIAWQRPGQFTLALPLESLAATRLEDMGLVKLSVLGWPVFTGVQEEWSIERTIDTGRHGVMVQVSGQSIHRFLGNRITGPFPGSFDHDTGALGELPVSPNDVEVYSGGDASPRGTSYGASSTSAESIMRKMLRTHTELADTKRKTQWTSNIKYSPDGRRGASPIEVRTRLKPLLGEAEQICQKADCGYGVYLTSDGYFKWFFLPGIDRTSGEGAWFFSPDISNGIDAISVNRSLTELVTHAYVVSSPIESSSNSATGRRMTVRSQGGKESYDRREVVVEANSATSSNNIALIGDSYLATHTYRRKVTVSIQRLLDAGWLTAFQVGDKVNIYDPETGVTEQVRIYEIQLTIGTENAINAILDDVSPVEKLNKMAEDYDNGNFSWPTTTRDGLIGYAEIITGPNVPGAYDSWKNDSVSTGGLSGAAPDYTFLPSLTAKASEMNNLAGVVAGTTTASKALVVDSSKKVDALKIGTSEVDTLRINTAPDTSAGAGGSYAIPANASGFVQVNINGSTYKIPLLPV